MNVVFGTRLQRHGISTHAGRNTARLALAAELPASVLADLTGISISTAERWSQWAKRHWASYVGQRATDIQADPGLRACSPESTKLTTRQPWTATPWSCGRPGHCLTRAAR
ncbi:MAG TPA: hypothetical protein VGM79_09305 [Streptosporangiaceae bacterium]